jgi:hypothetical protein
MALLRVREQELACRTAGGVLHEVEQLQNSRCMLTLQAEQNMQELQAQEQPGEEAAASTPIMPTEEDVREELLPLLLQAVSRQQHGGSCAVQHSLLAVTMLCMLPGYEARAADFMLPAFQEFPGKVFW